MGIFFLNCSDLGRFGSFSLPVALPISYLLPAEAKAKSSKNTAKNKSHI